jgi:GNAT superfamily N-acetyltransferase
MTAFPIVIADTASPSDGTELRRRIFEFNVETTGFDDARSLSCFLRDDAGTLVAGIDGFTWGGYARVEFLWLAAEYRGQRLGSRLLAAAEETARARGCGSIVLDTHEFQAPGFYEKLGYALVGTTHDTPRGFRQFLFQKRL